MIHDATNSAWIYFKVYVGSHVDRLDWLVTEMVPRALDAGEHTGWFFLRYVDGGGAHLRLRLRVPSGRASELRERFAARIRPSIAGLPTLPPSSYRPAIVPSETGMVAPSRAPVEGRLESDDYEPEISKFGERGMPVAERLFEASSHVALKILEDERDELYSRKTLVPLLMREALVAFPTKHVADDFWRSYGTFWLGGESPDTTAWRARFTTKADALAQRGVRVMTPDDDLAPDARKCLESWRTSLAEAAAQYATIEPQSLRENLAFQFAHLMNNRLGITILEEAYFARLVESAGRMAVAS